MTRQKYVFLIFILGSLTALGPFSIDMYLPGFPVIADYMHTSTASVALSLSSFFIGISVGQLLYGPLLDRFGRKKPLYAGLLVYILASFACAFTTSIDGLIAMRFIQAIGSCAAGVASMAMVRDLFPIQDIPKVFAQLMLVIALSPMLAPTIGSYVIAAWGWQSVFIVLMGMGVAILLAARFLLPSAYEPDTTLSLKPAAILSNFGKVLREPQFYTYALTGAVAFSGLFTYVAGSPMVFMDIFGLSEEKYGWVFASLSVSFIGSSQINSLLLRRFTSQQLVQVALSCQAIIGIAFLVAAISGWLTLPITLMFLAVYLSCLGFTNPNTAGLALAPFARNAGSASAVMGATQMGFGALASLVIGMFEAKSIVPMVTLMACSSALALTILTLGKRNIKHAITSDADIVPVH
ncbi:multidrug effflux MFS transporter [soil metagenome]